MEIAYAEALKTVPASQYGRCTVIPPNRLETSNWDLLYSLCRCRDERALVELRDILRKMTGRQHIFFAPSCRAAIAQILSLLPQQEVLMPAFTCPVVRTAVQLAGKRIVYVDIDRTTLNATSAQYAEKAKRNQILLPTHLFGIPTDIGNICRLAGTRGCVTIEDAAAAIGATRDGRMLGTFGDFGVVSFEKSKRVPAFRGAAIIVNNEQLLDLNMLASYRPAVTERRIPLHEFAFSCGYNLATIPWVYGRVTLPRLLRRYIQSSPSLEDDQLRTAANTPFYNREFHPCQAQLALRVLQRLCGVREHIGQLVSIYKSTLRATSLETFIPPGCDEAALLRFPIAFHGQSRAEVLRRALQAGLYLETNYERILPPRSEWTNYPNSLWAADNLVLLPLYRSLSPRNAELLANKVSHIATELSLAACDRDRGPRDSTLQESWERAC